MRVFEGFACCARYMLRVTVVGKGINANVVKDFQFWVRNYDPPEEEDENTKVGLLLGKSVGMPQLCFNGLLSFECDLFQVYHGLQGMVSFLLVKKLCPVGDARQGLGCLTFPA